ncbi:MAG: hypothetical protein IJJ33_20595, partial [Victivallales bacterium]|nr:hypothetical protein [Victivallales bacterium]
RALPNPPLALGFTDWFDRARSARPSTKPAEYHLLSSSGDVRAAVNKTHGTQATAWTPPVPPCIS